MKIEVWSDYVCPFCYIGKRRLDMALSGFSQRGQVEVVYKSFELDPNAPKEAQQSIHEMLAQKYSMTVEQAKEANENVGKQAETVGLTYHFDEMKPSNTFDAHRLTKYAKTLGKDTEITEALLHAYFTESKHLSNEETLAEIAETVGIDRAKALEIVKDKHAYAQDVRHDQTEAQSIGVRGVPFFVINKKYAISGAQPIETFINALQQVWQEENQTPVLKPLSANSSDGTVCTDESCIIPQEDK
ncbi:DsbA family oxidoreductase [Bacillus benzoevorans]|uniref:Putative DsbA family dithiol-disulfide isomerase n=1 Tax=Bacillus benzoevorans TaxID=1456 RepID=A0A7X0HSW7_9BACI|nr:DsbA family oxidoreductase [Bacillus benzoevorans]MBB6445307.1 putative DsbA family dithiol-disulfide isomerase [Bacillus benzoevorans]